MAVCKMNGETPELLQEDMGVWLEEYNTRQKSRKV